MNWAEKVALTTMVVASIVLIAAIRLAIRLGGLGMKIIKSEFWYILQREIAARKRK